MRSIALFLLPSLVAAEAVASSSQLNTLNKRHLMFVARAVGTCADQGQQACGAGCIDLGWTCCSLGHGGCSPAEHCIRGSNGEDACCPNGQTCSGPGGVMTLPGPLPTSAVPAPGTGTGGGSGGGTGGGSVGGCLSTEKLCGANVCIPQFDTCCPDGSGGCPSSETCQKGDDGKYGCCPLGKSCVGNAPPGPGVGVGTGTETGSGGGSGSGSSPSVTFGSSQPTSTSGSLGSGTASGSESVNSTVPSSGTGTGTGTGTGSGTGSGSLSGGGSSSSSSSSVAGSSGSASAGSKMTAMLASTFVAAGAIIGLLMI